MRKWTVLHESNVYGRIDYLDTDIRILTVIDEETGECLALEADDLLTDRRITADPNRIALFRSLPKEILTDNCSEFTVMR